MECGIECSLRICSVEPRGRRGERGGCTSGEKIVIQRCLDGTGRGYCSGREVLKRDGSVDGEHLVGLSWRAR